MGRQYAKNNMPINVVQPKVPIEQIKQEQNYRQSYYNPNYDNQRKESQGWGDIDKKEIKDGKTIKGINKIVMDNLVDLGVTKMVTIEIMELEKEGIWTIFVVKKKALKEWLSTIEATFRKW